MAIELFPVLIGTILGLFSFEHTDNKERKDTNPILLSTGAAAEGLSSLRAYTGKVGPLFAEAFSSPLALLSDPTPKKDPAFYRRPRPQLGDLADQSFDDDGLPSGQRTRLRRGHKRKSTQTGFEEIPSIEKSSAFHPMSSSSISGNSNFESHSGYAGSSSFGSGKRRKVAVNKEAGSPTLRQVEGVSEQHLKSKQVELDHLPVGMAVTEETVTRTLSKVERALGKHLKSEHVESAHLPVKKEREGEQEGVTSTATSSAPIAPAAPPLPPVYRLGRKVHFARNPRRQGDGPQVGKAVPGYIDCLSELSEKLKLRKKQVGGSYSIGGSETSGQDEHKSDAPTDDFRFNDKSVVQTPVWGGRGVGMIGPDDPRYEDAKQRHFAREKAHRQPQKKDLGKPIEADPEKARRVAELMRARPKAPAGGLLAAIQAGAKLKKSVDRTNSTPIKNAPVGGQGYGISLSDLGGFSLRNASTKRQVQPRDTRNDLQKALDGFKLKKRETPAWKKREKERNEHTVKSRLGSQRTVVHSGGTTSVEAEPEIVADSSVGSNPTTGVALDISQKKPLVGSSQPEKQKAHTLSVVPEESKPQTEEFSGWVFNMKPFEAAQRMHADRVGNQDDDSDDWSDDDEWSLDSDGWSDEDELSYGSSPFSPSASKGSFAPKLEEPGSLNTPNRCPVTKSRIVATTTINSEEGGKARVSAPAVNVETSEVFLSVLVRRRQAMVDEDDFL